MKSRHYEERENNVRPDKDNLKDRIERDFSEMDEKFSATQPGIANILEVYGRYEQSVRQANQYLRLLDRKPSNFTTNRSNP